MTQSLESNEEPDLASFPSAQAQDGAPLDRVRVVKTKRFRFTRFLVGFVGLFAVLALIGGAVGYYLISSGPINSERLRLEAEQQLSDLIGSNRQAKIGKTSFAFGKNGLISLDAQDVSILENGETNLGIIGKVSVQMKALPLLKGQVVANRIDLQDGQIAVGRLLNPNHYSTAVDGPDASILPNPKDINIGKTLSELGALLEYAESVISDGGLDAISIVNAKIVDFSQLGLRTQSARLMDFHIERNVQFQEGLFFSGQVETPTANITLAGQWRRLDEGGKFFSVEVRGADLKELTPPGDDSYIKISAPMNLRFSAPFSKSGEPQQALLEARLGEGSLQIDKELKSAMQSGALNIRFLPQKNQIELERSPFAFDDFQTVLLGGLRFANAANENKQPIFELIANDMKATAFNRKTKAGAGALVLGGRIENGWSKIKADRVQVKMASGTLDGAVELSTNEKGSALSLQIKTDKVDVEEFKQFWPPMIATGAREWVFKNLSGGSMRNASVSLKIPSGSMGSEITFDPKNLVADLPLVGARIKTFGQVPDIQNAVGTLRQRGMETFVELDKGTANLPSGRKLTLAKSKLKLGDFSQANQTLSANLAISGTAPAVAELGTRKPLAFTKELGLKPSDLQGTIAGDLQLNTTFRKSGIGAVKWKVSAKAKGFGSKQPVQGTSFSNADVNIVAEPGTARIKGKANVNGVRANVDMVESFGGSSRGNKRSVTFVLNEKERRKLGIDTAGLLSGTTSVSLSSKGGNSQHFDVDLKKAKLSLPWIGWSKGAGIPAKASFDLTQKGKTQTLKNFKLRGSGFSANGTLVVDKGGLASAKMQGVRLNKTDDLDITVKRIKSGYSVQIDARSYDGRAIIRSLMNDGGKSSASSKALIKVSGRVRKLFGFQRQTLTGVSLDYTQNNGRVRRADIRAVASGNAPVRFSIRPEVQGMTTKVTSSNAGSVLRFLDIYSKVRGGALAVDLVDRGKGRRTGTVTASRFTLLDEPRLGELLKPPGNVPDSRVDGRRAVREITKVNPNRVEVKSVFARVDMRPKTLIVKKGRLRGGDAGAAFEGLIYDANNRVDIKGTFLPAYGLNKFVSKIPIIGLAFGNGRSKGLIGITFRLRGAYRNPKLLVNPISILTPGVFRKLFEF